MKQLFLAVLILLVGVTVAVAQTPSPIPPTSTPDPNAGVVTGDASYTSCTTLQIPVIAAGGGRIKWTINSPDESIFTSGTTDYIYTGTKLVSLSLPYDKQLQPDTDYTITLANQDGNSRVLRGDAILKFNRGSINSQINIQSVEQVGNSNQIGIILSGVLTNDVINIRMQLADNSFSQLFTRDEVVSAIKANQPLYFSTSGNTTNGIASYNRLVPGNYSVLAEPLNGAKVCAGQHSLSASFSFSAPVLSNLNLQYNSSLNKFEYSFVAEAIASDVSVQVFNDGKIGKEAAIYTVDIPLEDVKANTLGSFQPNSFVNLLSANYDALVIASQADPANSQSTITLSSIDTSAPYYPSFGTGLLNLALRFWYVTLVVLLFVVFLLFLHQNHWYSRTELAPLAILPFQRHRALRKTQTKWEKFTELNALTDVIQRPSNTVQALVTRAQELHTRPSSLEKLENGAILVSEANKDRFKKRVRPLKHYDNVILAELARIQGIETNALFDELGDFQEQIKVYQSLKRPIDNENGITIRALENYLEWLANAIQDTRLQVDKFATYFTRATELEPFQYSGELVLELRQLRQGSIANDLLNSSTTLQIMESRLDGFLKALSPRIPTPPPIPSILTENGPDYPNVLYDWIVLIFNDVKQGRQLFEGYNKQIETRLASTLEKVNQIEELLIVEEVLDSIQGKRFGGTLDILINGLRDVTQEVASALAQSGYGRRLALQEAHINAKNVQAALTTEAPDLAQRLKAVSELFALQRSVDESDSEKTYSNPYITGNPIRANLVALFKGRTNLTADIVNRLRGGRRGTILLHGARRMGKSSFLYHLENLLPTGFIPVLVDCQGAVTENEASFFWSIGKRIYDVLRRRDSALGSRLSRPVRDEYLESPSNRLEEWLNDDVIPSLGRRSTIFITLDEFEEIGNAIRDGRMSENILGQLRHLIQHADFLVFMFVGVASLDVLTVNAASYFISVSSIELGYLDRVSAENLILRPFEPEDPTIKLPETEIGRVPKYDDDAVDEILRLTRHQPYLIQAFCEQVIELANNEQLENITIEHVGKIADKMDTAYPNYFDFFWNEWGLTGQEVLRSVVNGIPINASEDTHKVIDAMVRHRLIEPMGHNQYTVEIPLMEMYLARKV